MTTRGDLFRKFLNGLPARAGYCVDCLSKLWREPANTISGYSVRAGLSAAMPNAVIAASART